MKMHQHNMVKVLLVSILFLILRDVHGQCSVNAQNFSVGYSTVTITSPGYPNRYAPNLDCRWIASSLITGNEILYQLVDIFTTCPSDVINVYNGTSTSGIQILNNACGSGRSWGARISTTGSVYTTFTSDATASSTEKGFKLFMLSAKEFSGTGCNGTTQVLTATTTEQYLTSPNFPYIYPMDTDCAWTITTSNSNANIFIDVKFMDIERYSCRYDFLRMKENETVVATFCKNKGFQDVPNFTSSDTSITLEFHSDNEYSYRGFFLSFVEIVNNIDRTTTSNIHTTTTDIGTSTKDAGTTTKVSGTSTKDIITTSDVIGTTTKNGGTTTKGTTMFEKVKKCIKKKRYYNN